MHRGDRPSTEEVQQLCLGPAWHGAAWPAKAPTVPSIPRGHPTVSVATARDYFSDVRQERRGLVGQYVAAPQCCRVHARTPLEQVAGQAPGLLTMREPVEEPTGPADLERLLCRIAYKNQIDKITVYASGDLSAIPAAADPRRCRTSPPPWPYIAY